MFIDSIFFALLSHWTWSRSYNNIKKSSSEYHIFIYIINYPLQNNANSPISFEAENILWAM